MLRSIKRLQLRRRGFASRRRKTGENELLAKLDDSSLTKALVFTVFFGGMSLLMLVPQEVDTLYEENVFQGLFLVAVVVLAAVLQFFANHPNSYGSNARTVLVFGVVLIQLGLVALFQFLVHRAGLQGWKEHGSAFFLLIMPYLFAPMTMSVLLGRRQAMFVTVLASILGCLLVSKQILFPFFLSCLVGGIVSVYATHEVRRRSRIIRAGLYVALALIILAFANGTLQLPVFAEASSWTWKLTGALCLAAVISAVLSASLVSGFLPLLEYMFRITTNISWIEMTDPNHPLLRRMTIEAPGTYVHSLAVANLSAAAAESVGANANLCRACSFFHDVGKLVKPSYFIENSSPDNNPHDALTPNMSALVIVAHVKEGVDLAVKHKLRPEVIDVIQEHHGTSLVYYFYRRALDLQKAAQEKAESGELREDDVPEVDPESFRYPGPIPQTRESAIISLADSVESASRALEKPTPQKIEQMVDDIVFNRLESGELNNCDLTINELTVVKKRFCKMLNSMLHKRISYPKDDGPGTKRLRDKSTKRLKDKKRSGKTSIIDFDAA